MTIPVFGARRALTLATSALNAGELQAASRALREYFSMRYVARGRRLRRIDVNAVLLAAACALLRGEGEELEGIATLLERTSSERAQNIIQCLQSAMRGNASPVINDAPGLMKGTPIAAFVPLIMLIAAERGLNVMNGDLARALERAFDDVEVTPELAARLALALAMGATRSGESARARELLSNMPAEAPRLHRLLAAIANGDRERAADLASELQQADLELAGRVVSTLALDPCIDRLETLYRVTHGLLPQQATVAVAAALATAYARESRADLGMTILDEQGECAQSFMLNSARAYVALAARDADAAVELLDARELQDSEHRALQLLALARAGHQRLSAAVRATRELDPAMASQIAGSVLAGLIDKGLNLDGDSLPTWLAARPDTPEALFVWSLMRHMQGQHAEAIAGFDQVRDAMPEVFDQSDVVDVAQFALARQLLREGDVAGAREQLDRVTSPRLQEPARALSAMILAVKEAADMGCPLHDAQLFINLVEDLKERHEPGTAEREQVEILARQAARERARRLLCRGEMGAAIATLDALDDDQGDMETTFLRLVAAILTNSAVAQVEHQLAEHAESERVHHGIVVLLSEVRAALHGGEAAIDTLEHHRSTLQVNSLIEEALTLAYGSAARGLDAKQAGFAEVRRSGLVVPDLLARQISDALGLEAPPAVERHFVLPTVRRAGREQFFPLQSIEQRIDVLMARAREAQRRPVLGAKIEPLLHSLRQAILRSEHSQAHELEFELIELMGQA